MVSEFCFVLIVALLVVVALLLISQKLSDVFGIRACWIVGSVALSVGFLAIGNFVVIALALILPVFFELLYPAN